MKFLILRILLPLLLFLIVRSVLRTLFAGGGVSKPEPPKVPASGELKKDPVCGTYVSAVGTPREQVGRDVVYFCSETCREQFVLTRRR
jgi:YHS domain-containing protein